MHSDQSHVGVQRVTECYVNGKTILFVFCMALVFLNVIVYIMGGHNSLKSTEKDVTPIALVSHHTPVMEDALYSFSIDTIRPNLRCAPKIGRYLTIKGNTGRLGNQMFAYASLLGIANATCMRPIENAAGTHVSLLTNAFRLSRDVITSNKTLLKRKFHVLKERGSAVFTPEFMTFHRNDTMLVGYLQSRRYFEHIANRLRWDFTFKDHIITPAKSWLSQVLANHSKGDQHTPTLIGIHVRRGLPAKSGYRTPDVTYFERAMAYYKNKYTGALFVAVSSKMAWVEKYLIPKRHDIVMTKKSNSAPLDMAILSLCNHTLMSVGTFGWWSAWLAGGDVVYYQKIAVPGSNAWKAHRFLQDHFPEHWIAME